jgi:UDP-N-acetylmuramyl pentapeptide phosphotransferase/UDP-N-acetylglucosamine-1-phosphate transferase
MLGSNLFLIPIIFISIFIISKNFKFLSDEKYKTKHKIFVFNDKNSLNIGGIFLSISFVFFFPKDLHFLNFYIVSILVLGLLSDKNIVSHPIIRLLLQGMILFLFILNNEININSIRLDFFDKLLLNNNFNIFFTLFCLLILMNGTNFIDGVNVTTSGYFLIITAVMYYLSSKSIINYDNFIFIVLLISLITFLVFNFLGYCLLGDSGSYVLALVFGFLLIDISNINSEISPYFIVLLLWYPAFENLFTLSRRRLIDKKNPSVPDNLHFHQLLYKFIERKKIVKKKFYNSLSGTIIIFHNSLIFLLAIQFYKNTKILILLTLLNVIIYIYLYIFFKKLNFKKK